MSDDVKVESTFEIGLQLPNGKTIFPPETFHGIGVDTPENRQVIFDSLGISADNLGAPQLRSHFKWLVREVQVITARRDVGTEAHDLDDPNLLPEPEQVNTTDDADFDDAVQTAP